MPSTFELRPLAHEHVIGAIGAIGATHASCGLLGSDGVKVVVGICQQSFIQLEVVVGQRFEKRSADLADECAVAHARKVNADLTLHAD